MLESNRITGVFLCQQQPSQRKPRRTRKAKGSTDVMSDSNAYLLAAYVVILGFIHSKDCVLICVSFCLSCFYTDFSAAYIAHPGYLNHLVIIMFMIPSLLLATKHVSITVLMYILLHWIASLDFILFPVTETVVSLNFVLVSTVLNLLIMISLIYANYNRDSYIYTDMDSGWMLNLVRSKIKTYSEGAET